VAILPSLRIPNATVIGCKLFVIFSMYFTLSLDYLLFMVAAVMAIGNQTEFTVRIVILL